MISTAQPKPPPRALEKIHRTRRVVDRDVLESQKVRARARGQCERREVLRDGFVIRCLHKAYHLHHMIGGVGRRGRGESAKAIRKQHLCARCHEGITRHLLQRVKGGVPHWTDVYRRVR